MHLHREGDTGHSYPLRVHCLNGLASQPCSGPATYTGFRKRRVVQALGCLPQSLSSRRVSSRLSTWKISEIPQKSASGSPLLRSPLTPSGQAQRAPLWMGFVSHTYLNVFKASWVTTFMLDLLPLGPEQNLLRSKAPAPGPAHNARAASETGKGEEKDFPLETPEEHPAAHP